MYNLNELITIRDALTCKIMSLDELIDNGRMEELKTLRTEELERVTALYKKVNRNVINSAQFNG